MALEMELKGADLERTLEGLMLELRVRVGTLPEFQLALARAYMLKGASWLAGNPVEFYRGGFHYEVLFDVGSTQKRYALNRDSTSSGSEDSPSAMIELIADREHGIYRFKYFDPSVESLTNTPGASNKILAVLQSL